MKIKAHTVTSLTNYISQVLSNDTLLNAIVVEGEVSRFKKYPSGHAYFTLKDDDSRLACVIFKSNCAGIDEIEDGTKLRLSGSVNIYKNEGRLQFIANSLQFVGKGELYERFLALKKKLQDAGYFDAALKKPLPVPKKVGLITSPKGAAIADFCSILKRRDPLIEIDFYPTNVQGQNAVSGIITALQYFQEQKNVDLVVLTRGGGSTEDLWIFNDERLAKAIINFDLPLVSAVGHEIDFTICDYLADKRAPTPSAAAEIISIDRYQLLAELKDDLRQCYSQVRRNIKTLTADLNNKNPEQSLHKQKYQNKEAMQKIDMLYQSLDQSLKQKLRYKTQQLNSTWQLIETKHPQKQLERGFVYSKDKNGKIIRSISDLKIADEINLYYKDGTINAVVKGVSNENS